MGQLFDFRRRLEKYILEHSLDEHKTKGQIALETGVIIGLLRESSPDNPDKLAKLEEAALKLFKTKI